MEVDNILISLLNQVDILRDVVIAFSEPKMRSPILLFFWHFVSTSFSFANRSIYMLLYRTETIHVNAVGS